jgi:hypothetical protein
MKRTLPALFGLALLSAQPASALSVLGKDFAAYGNRLVGSGGTLNTDLGVGGWSGNPGDIANAVTDTNPATFVVGLSPGSYVDVGLSQAAVNGAGADLEFFFVGGKYPHNFTLELFSGANSSPVASMSLAAGAGYTGFVTSTHTNEGIFSLPVDISGLGANGPVDNLRVGIGDGTDTNNSAVLSFVGAYHVAAVPVPAAVWMFGAGLIGLVGIARRRS